MRCMYLSGWRFYTMLMRAFLAILLMGCFCANYFCTAFCPKPLFLIVSNNIFRVAILVIFYNIFCYLKFNRYTALICKSLKWFTITFCVLMTYPIWPHLLYFHIKPNLNFVQLIQYLYFSLWTIYCFILLIYFYLTNNKPA